MKKTNLLLGIGLITLVLTGCGKNKNNNHSSGGKNNGGTEIPEHVHTFADEWSHDDDYHWHEPTCGHEVTADYGRHEFSQTNKQDATEQSAGFIDYECSICHYTKREVLPIIVHNHQISQRTTQHVAPTCTEDGYDEIETYCTSCGQVFNTQRIPLPALGHDLVSEPGCPIDCEHEWWDAYQHCTRCDYSTQVIHQPTGHIPGPEIRENEVSPTCTEEGSYTSIYRCQNCGMEISRNNVVIPALGHDLVHYPETDSTCSEHGHYAYDECTRCDYTTYEEKDLLQHQVHLQATMTSYPTFSAKGKFSYAFWCDVCGQKVSSGTNKQTGNSTHITLANSNIVSVIEGEVVPLTFQNTSSYQVKWLIEHEDILSVNNNQVTALKPGSSMIFAYNDGREIASVYINVIEDTLALELPQSKFYPTDVFTMGFASFPRNDRSLLSWSSSNESIATVDDDGNVTVLNTGEVSITATCDLYGLEDTISFTSEPHFAELDKASHVMGRGEAATILKSYSRLSIIEWISSDSSVAYANGNKVYSGTKYGTCNIIGRSTYLAEDIVFSVTVQERTATLSKSNYDDYFKATFTTEKVADGGPGYNWKAKVSIEFTSLWEADSAIIFYLEYDFKNTLTSGTSKVTLTVSKGSTESSLEYVMPTAYNTNIYGDEVKPSYTLTAVTGTVKK